MNRNIEDIIPIIDINNEYVLNIHEQFSIVYRVSYPDVFLTNKERYNSFFEKIRNFITLLPKYTICQCISLHDVIKYDSNYNESTNYVIKNNLVYYDQREVPVQEDYIIISLSDKPLPKSISSAKSFKKFSINNPYKNYGLFLEDSKNKLNQIKNKIKTAFDVCELELLQGKDIARLIYKFTSFDYNYSGDNFKLPYVDLKSNKIGKYNFSITSLYEGKKAVSFKTHKLENPSNVNSNVRAVDDIGNISQSFVFPYTIGLPFKHAFCLVIQNTSKERVFRDFEFLERAIALPASFGIGSAKQKKTSIDVMKILLEEKHHVPVNMSMCVIIPDIDKENLSTKNDVLETIATNNYEMKAELEIEETGFVFYNHFPFNAQSNYKSHLTTAYHASAFFPKESHYKNDLNGMRFVDRFGKPFLLNILTNPSMTNKNGVIIGPSGRGKSYTINYILSLIYNLGHVVIIDKGDSYINLCKLLKGSYYDSSNSEQFKFNIFLVNQDKDGKYIYDSIQTNLILGVLIFIWKKGLQILPEEKESLKKVVFYFYEYINKNQLFPTFTLFYDFIFNKELDKLLAADSNNVDIKKFLDFDSLKLMLEPYAYGLEKDLLNSKANMDLTNQRFVVFEMKSIEKSNPEKFQLLCLMIMYLNIKKIQNLPRHIFKSFLIDEAISFLKGDIGDFIGNLFAEVRKENGQVLIAAQGIKYILEASSEVQEKIFMNRDFIVMTNHSGYENAFDDYKEYLGFNNHDINLLSSIKKHEETLIKLGDKPVICRIDVSNAVHGAFSTDPGDMKKVKDLLKEFGSIETALDQF